MASLTRALLSGSTSGRPIKVAATAISSGTTIHTAQSGSTNFDEVYAWVTNTNTTAVTLTLGFGGTTDPDDLIVKTLSIPPNSPPIPVLTGQTLNGALVVKAAAGTANVLLISGHVNKITA